MAYGSTADTVQVSRGFMSHIDRFMAQRCFIYWIITISYVLQTGLEEVGRVVEKVCL